MFCHCIRHNFLNCNLGTKGTKVNGWAYWPRDPGYVDTARMVVESGLCMALEAGKLWCIMVQT